MELISPGAGLFFWSFVLLLFLAGLLYGIYRFINARFLLTPEQRKWLILIFISLYFIVILVPVFALFALATMKWAVGF